MSEAEAMTISATPGGTAFFDFDETLIEGDSLLYFLEELVGPLTARTMFAAAGLHVLAGGGRSRDAPPDFKGRVKAVVLRRVTRNLTLQACRDAAQRVAMRLRWDARMLAVVAEHRAAGRAIVVATGALDIYLPELLVPLGEVDAVLSTRMEVAGDRLTGAMASANCVRAEKARRVGEYIAAFGGGPSYAYGNRPSDLPMLAVVDKGFVVRLRGAENGPDVVPFLAPPR